MIRTVLVCCLFALAFADFGELSLSLPEDASTRVAEALVAKSRASLDFTMGFKLQGVDDATCAGAISEYQTIMMRADCSPLWAMYRNPARDLTVLSAKLIVSTYCTTSTCDTDLQAALGKVFTACSTLDPSTVSAFREVAGAAQIPCSKVGTTYCLPHFAALKSLAAVPSSLTKANLDAVCHPCVNHAFELISTYSDRSVTAYASVIALYCDQVGGEYGYLQLQDLTKLSTNPTTNEALDLICRPAFTHYIFSFYLSLEYVDPSLTQLYSIWYLQTRFLCEKHNGQYCFYKLMSQAGLMAIQKIQMQCATTPAVTLGACPVNCKKALQAYKSSFGCCTNTFIYYMQFLELAGAGAGGISFQNATWAFTDWCQVGLPSTCVSFYTDIWFNVNGVKYDWYLANKQAFLDLVLNATLIETGANSGSILPPNTTAVTPTAATTIQVGVRVDGLSDKGAGLQAQLATGYVLPGLNSGLTPEALEDVSQPVTVSGTVALTKKGAASAVAPVFSLFALGIALMLLLV